MSKLVHRILGERARKPSSSEPFLEDKEAEPILGRPNFVRDFILSGLGRPGIELRYEQVFAQKLGLGTAQCRSTTNGPFTKIEIQFDLPEGSRLQLSRLYFTLREVAQLFQRQPVPRSALLELMAGAATLTFTLEPLN